jgi:hypothetical protein
MGQRRMAIIVGLIFQMALLSSTMIPLWTVQGSTVMASSKSFPHGSRRNTSSHHHHHHADCNGRPNIPAKRHACGLFLWDAPSALLYKWCQYLLKDHVYEGRGGYLFVRYESNSILQLLYPCTRYAPNKCLICGGTFPDHLELWWSKHLYTPFDQWLDKTYNAAMDLSESSNLKNKSSNKSGRTEHQSQIMEQPPSFAFHKRYVEDITHLATIENSQERRAAIKNWLEKQRKTRAGGITLRVGSSAGVTYATAIPNGDKSFRNSLAEWLSFVVLGAVDEMIQFQELENKKRKVGAQKRTLMG